MTTAVLRKRVRAQWETRLATAEDALKAIPAIMEEKRSRDDIPRVVNVVTTFQLISQVSKSTI